MNYKTYIILLAMLWTVAAAWAEAIGSWRVHRSYSLIEDIIPTGKKVYVKAYGNLYSYNTADGSVKTYTKEDDGMGSQDIDIMAWCEQSKKLVLVYEDYTIDIVSDDATTQTIISLKEKRMTTDKTVNNIYMSGPYAYLTTAFGLLKIDTREAVIEDTYTIGLDILNMTETSDSLYLQTTSHVYAAGKKDNLKDANVWRQTETSWESVCHVSDVDYNDYGLLVKDEKNNCYWGSDEKGRLQKYQKNDETEDNFSAVGTGVIPDGPLYPEHTFMRMYNGKLHSLRGLYNLNATGNLDGYVQTYDGENWAEFDNTLVDNVQNITLDFMTMDIDPLDKNHIMVGGQKALFEFRNGVMTEKYTGSNSIKEDGTKALVYNANSVITSLAYDKSGNLWIFNRNNPSLVCYTKDKTWKTYEPVTLKELGNMSRYVSAFVDSRGLLWFCKNHYNSNFFGFYNPQTNETRLLRNIVNQDGKNLNPYNAYDSRVVTEDKEGNIWYGTSFYAVYLTPDEIRYMINNENLSDVSVTQHKVPRNDGTGLADYLMNGIAIRDIKVDAANRKWIATDANGVYLISSDNNTTLEHFTTENSPLLSNDVYSICIDDNNGRVYFGTQKGVCSYETGVTKSYGEINKDQVYAYPNPVSPDYTGDITIKGLVENTQVKITTSSGYVVHEGVSNGAVYKWNGCDKNGDRVASGVYMVLVATEKGEEGCVTKIAMVK